jgi:1-acyl-sn-glycerol-3-phosphate acyltransferase
MKTLKMIWSWVCIGVYLLTHLFVWLTLGATRFVNNTLQLSEPWRHTLLFTWFWFWSSTYLAMVQFLLRVKIDYKGLDKISKGQPVIVASRHISFFDHLINTEVLRQLGTPRALWAMKEDVFKFQGLGGWAKDVGCAALKRGGTDTEGDIDRLGRMAHTAGDLGESVLIYPEGRRSATPVRPKTAGFMALANARPDYPIVYVDLNFNGVEGGKEPTDMGSFIGAHIIVTVTRQERTPDENLEASLLKHFGFPNDRSGRREAAK